MHVLSCFFVRSHLPAINSNQLSFLHLEATFKVNTHIRREHRVQNAPLAKDSATRIYAVSVIGKFCLL